MESKQLELKFCKIDTNGPVNDLLQAIKEILVEGNSHNASVFSAANWLWQYQKLPDNDARVFICLKENKIAGYYHAPVYSGIINGQQKKFGMVQDVAVSSSLRGGGVFRKLAEYATNELDKSNLELIYTFPNKKSIHTFLKYNGYRHVCAFDAYILPVRTSSIIKSKINLFGFEKIPGFVADTYFDFQNIRLKTNFKFEVKDCFDDETISLFQNFNNRFNIHLNRTKEYMQWRFFEKPVGKHFLITLKDKDKLIAATVIKIDKLLGVDAVIILDFAFEEEKYLMLLINHLRKNDLQVLNKKVALIFVAFCCNQLLQNKKYGFIKIPEKYNPRPLNMLVKNIKANNLFVTDKKNWFANLADWDVF